MKLNVGDKIPEFKLNDQNGEEVTLSDFEGKNVLLSFHPLAWTGVCTKQMEALERNYDKFTKNNTAAVGLSVDPVPSKKAWAEDMGLEKLKILSDFWPHGEFASQLGIFIEEKGISGRVNILLNDNGEIVWFKVYDIPELPDIDEVIAAVEDNS